MKSKMRNIPQGNCVKWIARFLCAGLLLVTLPLHAENRLTSLSLDFFLPGYGAFSHDSPLAGGLILGGRAGTIYLAFEFWQKQIEYRSAARAARAAEVYFGPGYRYKDPFDSGYRTAQELDRLAGRNTFYYSLSLSFHAVITIVSLVFTNFLVSLDEKKDRPVFDIQADVLPGTEARGVRFIAGFSVRDF